MPLQSMIVKPRQQSRSSSSSSSSSSSGSASGNDLEIYHDSAILEIASTMRQSRHTLVPEWPELVLVGQPIAFPMPAQGSPLTTFDTFRTTYSSLCTHLSLTPNDAILHFTANLYRQGDRDFNIAQIPGIESNGSSEGKDPLYAQVAPLLLALKFDRFFLGIVAHGVLRKELVSLLAQVIRFNYTLTKLQISNTDADANSLLELSVAMKENRSLRLQIIEVSDHKSMEQRFLNVIASTLTTYPIPRLSHLNLGKSGIPAKGLTKLFQAFTMNYSISLGISHLNLSGSKFDSDTVAALELWLELGGNYSHLEELILSNISGFPFKPLPKFKACTKLQKLDMSENKLDSSSDLKSLSLLLTESPSLRNLDFSSCGIERSSIFDTLIASIRKMKSDSIEINLSNNTAPASDSKWVAALHGTKLKSISLNGIHFKESSLDDLLAGFQKFSTLQSFSICDCKTKPKNEQSLTAFSTFPVLQTLSLSNSFDMPSIVALLRDMSEKNRSILNLDISCNLLGDEAAMTIIKLVGQTSTLKRLNCDGNALSFSAWQGIYQAMKNNPKVAHMQYPHGDMVGLMSWASTTLNRHSAIITQVLGLHDLLRTVTVDNPKDPRGSLTPVEPRVDIKETPIEVAPAAPIPSHLASQHSEMKLEDLGEWISSGQSDTSSEPGSAATANGSNASSATPGMNGGSSSLSSSSAGLPRPTSMRTQAPGGSLRRPSAADVFSQPSQQSSSAPSSPASTPQPPSPRSHSVSVSTPGSSPMTPRMPLPLLPNGVPPRAMSSSGPPSSRPPLPNGGKVPSLNGMGGSSSLGLNGGGPPSALPPPTPSRVGSGSLSVSPRDEFGINPMSSIAFGSYGQCDEEIDPDEPVRQATINEMVIRLAHEATSDVKFMHTFLLTYRATVEPVELLDRLISRFFSKPTGIHTKEELKIWAEQTLRPIRIRVMNVLKRWCEAHWQDFASDSALIATLEAFLRDGAVLKNHEAASSSLLAHIQRQVANSAQHKVVMSATLRSRFDPDKVSSSATAGNSSSSDGVIGLLAQYTPEEIAEQMCLLESDLFSSLQIKEFFNQGWNKGSNEQKDLVAPNIRLMIKVSNQIITWIAHEILRQPSASARTKAIGKAIQIAILLNEKNNFNGVKEITAGLCLSSIQRLKKAWSAVKPKFKQAYNDLTDKVANMQSLRNLPHSVNPPLVPYLGVYLTDLVFIEDGNPNTFEEDGLTFINFRKMSIMGEVLMEISSYQQERYCFLKIDDLYNYLLIMEAHSDTELHALSQTAEPKKR